MRRFALAVAVAALLAAAAPASAHNGNPNYLSQVDSITPSAGVTVEVLNRDDRLLLHNASGKDVVIEGYDEEPYARVLADGTVEVNTDSEAYHLNEDRFADVELPARADSKGTPRWRELSRTGRFEWHDHRAHWMGTGLPPQVADEGRQTKIFDWSVPIEVGGEKGAIRGTLFWTPLPGGGMPAGAIAGLAGVIIAGSIAVAVVRRRRGAGLPAEAAW
jgi:hypothetical protein